MRFLAFAALLVCALPSGSMADKPSIGRPTIKAMEGAIDVELLRIWPNDPAQVVGLTQGLYIDGYGAVFMAEMNLAPSAGISPFHPLIKPDEMKRLHEKKAARIAQLKVAMQDILLNSAGSLDSLPGDQQIALGISLFYWHGENTEGLPAQIVMHAAKRALLDVKTGRADKSTLAAALTTQEF